MPFVSEKFPELPQICFAEKIVFSTKPRNSATSLTNWSIPISITNDLEQFVNIPTYGDVKLVVKVTAYTTLLTVDSVSEVEINAIDIRGRLSRHELEITPNQTVIDPDTKDSSESIASRTDLSVDGSGSQMSLYKSLFVPTVPSKSDWNDVTILIFIKSFSILFFEGLETDLEKQGVASFTFDDIGAEICQTWVCVFFAGLPIVKIIIFLQCLTLQLSIYDVQFDNLLYSRESYDFPVVFVSQEKKVKKTTSILDVTVTELLQIYKDDALVTFDVIIETWKDPLCNKQMTGIDSLNFIHQA